MQVVSIKINNLHSKHSSQRNLRKDCMIKKILELSKWAVSIIIRE